MVDVLFLIIIINIKKKSYGWANFVVVGTMTSTSVKTMVFTLLINRGELENLVRIFLSDMWKIK